MPEILYGRNAVLESLRARRRHAHRLLLADNLASSKVVTEVIAIAKQLKIKINRVPRKKLDTLAKGHQGVALETGRYPMVTVDEILERANKVNQPPFILALDHLEDPHNLGAILRTAEVVGVHGVILPKKRSVHISPTVVNVSAGAAEHLWVAMVPNLVQTLKYLKQADVWVAGVEFTSQATFFHQTNLSGSITLVIGSEGKGLSQLVRKTCDFLVKLPMRGQINSLNASVAAGLLLYEVWRTREFTK